MHALLKTHPVCLPVLRPPAQESAFLARHVLIAAADHGFCDGAAYQRQDPFRHAPFDTAVLVLQTAKAGRKWVADDAFEAALRGAFAACVPSDAAVARQLKRGAGALPKGAEALAKKQVMGP